VGVAVVLAGAVVAVVGTGGRELLEPLPDVFMEAGLVYSVRVFISASMERQRGPLQ
jgi:hypothetical protein